MSNNVPDPQQPLTSPHGVRSGPMPTQSADVRAPGSGDAVLQPESAPAISRMDQFGIRQAASEAPIAPAQPSAVSAPFGWLAGVVTACGLLWASVGYLVAMSLSGILEELLEGHGNSAENLLWLSISIPALAGLASIGALATRSKGGAMGSAAFGGVALITALAQFAFGAPPVLYVAGYAASLVAAAHIVASLAGLRR